MFTGDRKLKRASVRVTVVVTDWESTPREESGRGRKRESRVGEKGPGEFAGDGFCALLPQ